MQGFSSYDRPGGVFHDPQATRAFVDGLRRGLSARPDIRVDLADAHINDSSFVRAACERLWTTMQVRCAATGQL